MSRGKKILIGIGVLVVLAIMTAVALRGGRDGAVEVRTEAVSRRDLVAKVSAVSASTVMIVAYVVFKAISAIFSPM